MLGLDIEIFERTHQLKSGQHAQRAIKFPACRLRVEMTADHHGRKRIVGTFAARKHRPHLVHRNGTTGILAPRLEQFSRLKIEIG